nr:MAG TPA: Protein of unknown function (DUF1642) [Caudoviricetes sp.]
MDRQEAVQKLARAGRFSIAHAEDLYDSFFPKPVVPQFVADWYEEHKDDLNSEIYYLIRYWEDEERNSDFYKWFDDTRNEALITLVNMHQFGYEVEKEARYMVRFKWLYGGDAYLTDRRFANYCDIRSYRDEIKDSLQHTRKELEASGFGWVFSCPGVEVKEVTDE